MTLFANKLPKLIACQNIKTNQSTDRNCRIKMQQELSAQQCQFKHDTKIENVLQILNIKKLYN